MSAATPAVQPPQQVPTALPLDIDDHVYHPTHVRPGSRQGQLRPAARRITVAEPVTVYWVAATAAADSFTTGNPKRDKHPRSVDFLQADTHPDISFRSTGLIQDGASWVLRGTITARGNTAPVELTIIEASTNPTGRTVRATWQGRPLRAQQHHQAERHGRPLPDPDDRRPRRPRLTPHDEESEFATGAAPKLRRRAERRSLVTEEWEIDRLDLDAYLRRIGL